MKQTGILLILTLLLGAYNNTPQASFLFSEVNPPTKASLRGLSVINEHCVWISGSEGTVMRTSNGGQSWIDCSIHHEANNDFRSIHALDSLQAFVIGINNPAIIYHTANGGRSWDAVDSISAKGLFFNSLKFADANRALAVSDPVDGHFYILSSKNGGRQWQQVTKLPPALIGEGGFAASNTCIEYLTDGSAWIVTGGSEARVFFSKDDGASWKVSATPVKAETNANGLYSIAFTDAQNGIAVGGSYITPENNDSIAAYSHDGGINWHLAQTMPSGYRSCVQYFSVDDYKMAIAIGKTGFDYSLDGGINWKCGGQEGYYTIRAVPDKAKGFVAGANGRVAKIELMTK